MINNKTKTHFTFNGKEAYLSSDLVKIIQFLQEIEKELETILNFQNNLEDIKKQYLDIVGLVDVISKKLIEHSIDFEYKFSEHPEKIINKFKITRPVRSEMIILFANLETLYCLNIAYTYKLTEKNQIINKAMNRQCTNEFIKKYCLNNKNEWCENNPKRYEAIKPDDLRDLRNALTHFFSVSRNLSVSFPEYEVRELEKKTNFKVKFLSSKDLFNIIRGAFKLIIEEWSDDYAKSLENEENDFQEKISSVKHIVDRSAAIIVKDKQINI